MDPEQLLKEPTLQEVLDELHNINLNEYLRSISRHQEEDKPFPDIDFEAMISLKRMENDRPYFPSSLMVALHGKHSRRSHGKIFTRAVHLDKSEIEEIVNLEVEENWSRIIGKDAAFADTFKKIIDQKTESSIIIGKKRTGNKRYEYVPVLVGAHIELNSTEAHKKLLSIVPKEDHVPLPRSEKGEKNRTYKRYMKASWNKVYNLIASYNGAGEKYLAAASAVLLLPEKMDFTLYMLSGKGLYKRIDRIFDKVEKKPTLIIHDHVILRRDVVEQSVLTNDYTDVPQTDYVLAVFNYVRNDKRGLKEPWLDGPKVKFLEVKP